MSDTTFEEGLDNQKLVHELAALRAIIEGTSQATGDQFFHLLVENLCAAAQVSGAFVAQFVPDRPGWVRSVAKFHEGAHVVNEEWELEGTPCKRVVTGELCHYPKDVWRLFPKEIGVESYLGAPLVDADGHVMGHLAVFDEKAMPETPRLNWTFRIFAARAAAELERAALVERMQMAERRYRDLFDEAPIAYVMEDLDSNFVSANQTAMRVLGLRPDEIKGTRGKTLVADTPDARRRVDEAFEAIGRGRDTSGVILEMRRKDDGKPVFIEWWSRPDVDHQFTRTMFVDITERVLLEQEQARLRAQNQYLQEEIKSLHNFQEILGGSRALMAVLESVSRVAATDASVLIQGETGTGKELISRAIHAASKRAHKPLIKINCAALPQNLVESELFGHEKGAFTGAVTRRVGRFELADGGTIFLDEVGEMPMDLQVKLLRVLQEREIERVGSSTPIPIDVRIIAATNRDLRTAIKEKLFREDLFYRLNVFPVHTPPLRDRVEDIPLLAHTFVKKFATQVGKRIEGISSESVELMQRYAWPGNVRELQNVIERAVILADSPILKVELEGAESLRLPRPQAVPPLGPGPAQEMRQTPKEEMETEEIEIDTSLEGIERAHIVKVLEQCGWVIEGANGAAKALHMRASTLRHRMNKLNISRKKRAS